MQGHVIYNDLVKNVLKIGNLKVRMEEKNP